MCVLLDTRVQPWALGTPERLPYVGEARYWPIEDSLKVAIGPLAVNFTAFQMQRREIVEEGLPQIRPQAVLPLETVTQVREMQPGKGILHGNPYSYIGFATRGQAACSRSMPYSERGIRT